MNAFIANNMINLKWLAIAYFDMQMDIVDLYETMNMLVLEWPDRARIEDLQDNIAILEEAAMPIKTAINMTIADIPAALTDEEYATAEDLDILDMLIPTAKHYF